MNSDLELVKRWTFLGCPWILGFPYTHLLAHTCSSPRRSTEQSVLSRSEARVVSFQTLLGRYTALAIGMTLLVPLSISLV